MDWWDAFIQRNGWPAAIVFAMVGAGVLVFWMLWAAGKKLCAWAKPHVEQLVAKWVAFFDSHITSNEANTKTNEMQALSIATHTPLIKDTSEGVRHLVAETDHDQGRLSNVLTHQHLAEALNNQRLMARAGHEALDALAQLNPEWQSRFKPAIDVLEQIERGRA